MEVSERTTADFCDLSARVFSEYGIIRRIIENLPMGDVKRLSRTNKIFKTACENVIKDRRRSPAKPETICLVTPDNNVSSQSHLDLYAEILENHISEAKTEPAAMITLMGSDIESWIYAEPGDLQDAVDFHKSAKSVLPKQCFSVSIVNEGVIVMGSEEHVERPLEVENLTRGSFQTATASMIFPKSDSFQVIPFFFPENMDHVASIKNDLKAARQRGSFLLKPDETLDDILYSKAFLGQDPPDPKNIKCVIALSSDHESPYLHFFLRNIGSATGKKVAIGGAIGVLPRSSFQHDIDFQQMLNDVRDNRDTPLSKSTVGYVFSGSGVQTASVLIGSNVKNEAKVLQVLEELKKAKLNEENSCAFMFACCARGKHVYKKTNVESRAFQKLFPKTPIIGIFGGGEIGVNYVPGVTDQMRVTPTKVFNAVTFAIVFLIIWKIMRSSSKPKKDLSTCKVTRQFKDKLHNMVYEVHDILETLDVVHFLCYGSLFGQIRASESLDWERDAELCILNEDISQIDEGFVKRTFQQKGLDITYDSAEGQYIVTSSDDQDFNGFVQLFVFAQDKEIEMNHELMLHRVGWKRRVLPPDCEYYSERKEFI